MPGDRRRPAVTTASLRPVSIGRYRRALLRRFRVRTAAQCRRFVDALGFCYAFTAGPGGIPGLFDVIGTRSEDRMWSWAWSWKDDLVTQRRVFYGRVLRGKPTFISLACLPHFYALSGNVGEPDDYLIAYQAGQLTLPAKELFEFIARHGPINTWALRRQFVSAPAAGRRLHRALDELQGRFLIAKVAEAEGRGNYSYIWDTFARWMPDVMRQAGGITSAEAAGVVLDRYLRIVGAAITQQVQDLFRWPPSLLQSGLEHAGAVARASGGNLFWTLRDLPRGLK
jgi:hypothetical protein